MLHYGVGLFEKGAKPQDSSAGVRAGLPHRSDIKGKALGQLS